MGIDTSKAQILHCCIERNSKIDTAKQECIDKSIQYFSKLFEIYRTNGLTNIFVLGFTPAWNDGEDCKHKTCVHVDNDRKHSEYTDVLEYAERFERDLDWDNPPAQWVSVNSNLTFKNAKKIENQFHQDQHKLLEQALGTNWRLEITFTDKIEVHYFEYDCGY